ncbi:MAG: PorP/SprF family type IX secretion system membrane protein [Bacteroidetes bacterium]|nr:PorP/SprF family type IX secretion system membrane protein [Bacteroidota bacterium]
MLRIKTKRNYAACLGFVTFVSYSLISNQCISQDIHFAQLSETPLLINPALTGFYDGYYRGILNYRNQWPAMGKSFNTFMGSFDMPLELKKKKGATIGLGAYFYSDRAGDSHFGTTQGNLSASGILPLNPKSKISLGLSCGFAQHSLSLAAIQWPNQYNGYTYDPTITPNEQITRTSFTYIDVGAGANYEYLDTHNTIEGKNVIKLNAGASFSHATMPSQDYSNFSDENLYWKLIAHTSLRYDFPGSPIGIVPSAIYMMQGPASELFLGTLLRYKINQGTKVTNFYTESAFSAGVFYRYKDAISPQVYFEFANYGIGISYDFNISSYGEVKKSAGGFEISIKYANMKGALRKGKE